MAEIKLPCFEDLARAGKQLLEEGQIDVSSITHFAVEDVILSGELYLSRQGQVERMQKYPDFISKYALSRQTRDRNFVNTSILDNDEAKKLGAESVAAIEVGLRSTSELISNEKWADPQQDTICHQTLENIDLAFIQQKNAGELADIIGAVKQFRSDSISKLYSALDQLVRSLFVEIQVQPTIYLKLVKNGLKIRNENEVLVVDTCKLAISLDILYSLLLNQVNLQHEVAIMISETTRLETEIINITASPIKRRLPMDPEQNLSFHGNKDLGLQVIKAEKYYQKYLEYTDIFEMGRGTVLADQFNISLETSASAIIARDLINKTDNSSEWRFRLTMVYALKEKDQNYFTHFYPIPGFYLIDLILSWTFQIPLRLASVTRELNLQKLGEVV